MLLTAAHVVGHSSADDLAVLSETDSATVKVIFVKTDSDLDVAVLHVDGDFDVSPVRRPVPNESWRANTPSGGAMPDLSGQVTSVRRSWRNALGKSVAAVQLQVDQTLQSFKGYSGAGIVGDDGAAIGILVEQQPSVTTRTRDSSNSNVLYAVSVLAACDALNITPQRELPTPRASLPASMSYHEDVLESLRGYRSRLTSQDLRFVSPPHGAYWSPDTIWNSLSTGGVGSVLLVGHGGVGKTRTLLEVGDIANADGWDVIHVRGGNAVRVADTIAERVRDPSLQPVLLLLDYLNLARELDLLALTELANASGNSPRLRILATSRTGWELRHRQDAGMSRFARVLLTPDDDNAAAVCLAIVKQIAPTATQRYGAGAVLDVTGSRRPILAVLLGQIVEAQVAANGDLPAALVSEDIAAWLDDRLLEDEVLAAQESDLDVDLPLHMIIAAVCLAAAPAPRDELVSSALGAISSSSREQVAVTIDRLQRLGWIVDSTEGLAPAHDVVVDKLLEAAILHRDSGIVRESALVAALNTALTSPRAFGNVVASLERVLDERTARELSSSEVSAFATAWIMNSATSLATPLSEESPAGARVAAQVLESELWINDVNDRWRVLGSALLQALESSPLASEPLLVACRTLAKDVNPTISDRAVAWIIRQGASADEFVLNATLTRKDVAPDDSTLLRAIAIDSLSARTIDITADFTLRRLLRHPDITPEDLTLIHTDVKAWLEAHGESEHAVHLLSAVVDNEEFRKMDSETWERAWCLCIAWVCEHPNHSDAALALESLIKTDRAEGLFEETIWPLTAAWLNNHGSELAAVYVLESLLQAHWLSDFHISEVMIASRRWVDSEASGKATSFLIKELVIWERTHATWSDKVWELADKWLGTTNDFTNASWVLRTALRDRPAEDPLSSHIWVHVRRWLLRESTAIEARPLLEAALIWGYLEDSASAVLWGCAEKWLGFHLSRDECAYLIRNLCEWPGLERASGDRLLQVSISWFSAEHSSQAKQFLIQGLIEYIDHSGAALPAELWEQSENWLDRFESTPEASHVLRRLLQSAQVNELHGDAVRRRASRWLKSHSNENATVRVLRAVLSCSSTGQELDIVTPGVTSAIKELDPTIDRDTCFMLQELAAWPGVASIGEEAWGLAGRFLVLDKGKFGGFVIQAMVANPQMTAAIPDKGWSGVRSWLDNNGSERQAAHTLVALLKSQTLSATQSSELWPRLANWLTANPDEPKAIVLARAVYGSQHLGPIPIALVWPSIAARFGTLATRGGSRVFLQQIALGGHLNEGQISQFWACASRWLDRFGASYEANFLLQALVKMHPGDVQSEILWNHAFRWLTANNAGQTSAYLLIELIKWPDATGGRTEQTLEFARMWLNQNASAPKAVGIVAAIVRSQSVTNRQLEKFGSAIRAWLESSKEDGTRRSYLRVANSRALSKNRRNIACAIVRAA